MVQLNIFTVEGNFKRCKETVQESGKIVLVLENGKRTTLRENIVLVGEKITMMREMEKNKRVSRLNF